MKTITEFSGTIIRMAANALATAKAALPAEAPATETPATEGAPAAEAAAAPAAESEATKAALDEAVAKETGLSGDRLARLREALTAVGGKTADVRLVRVYAGDATVSGAKKVGEHQYVVDLMPQSMKPQFGRPEKERGGRGGGGGGRGGGRGQGGGASEGPPTGGFSMDSLKSDRGPGRRGPGGPKK